MGVENRNCFACGQDNPEGLHLKFYEEDGVFKAKFRPREVYQGYPGMLHGGIISTLLDEVMGKCLTTLLDIPVYTVQLDVRFKKIIKLDQEILIEGKIVNNSGRMVETEGRILLEDGTVAATGVGKFIKITEG